MTTPSKLDIEVTFKNVDALQRFAAQIAKDLNDGIYDIAQFLEILGFALTSSNVDDRVSGTRLLSAILAALPTDALSNVQLELLTTFYADRLKDHHNVIPAVIDGIDALMRKLNLPRSCVQQILQSVFQHTTCQAQVRSDRTKLFIIFKYLTEHFKAELVAMGGDFLYGLISSIDGERDPRNLDFIFSFMPDFISNYPLLHLTDDLFEIFACYFPIDFNPSKNDPSTITRDILAEKLSRCLVAAPEFAESAVALAVEKLESDLIVAKLDSIELLQKAASKFAPKMLEPNFEQIWQALKMEIFPGNDNTDVVTASLKALTLLLESAALEPEISRKYQSTILGVVLTHLSDVNQRLFKPANAIALVCIAGDATFAADKILNTFVLKLKTIPMRESEAEKELRIKIYGILAQIFKIITLRSDFKHVNTEIAKQLQEDAIVTLCLLEQQNFKDANLDMQRAALCVLQECVPSIGETERALIYKILVLLVTHEVIELDFTQLTIELGALFPIELQIHFIDVCICNFDTYRIFVKKKIFTNLLPLVPQLAFAQRIIDFFMTHVFKAESKNDVRLLALEALNNMLKQQDQHFIVELQENTNLIFQLIELAHRVPLELKVLVQLAEIISRIVQQLHLAEQYAIITEYLPVLNLQITTDFFIANGLLCYMNKDISLDEHFESLLTDLTQLALQTENETLRTLAHHLLCSLVNKTEHNKANRAVLTRTVLKLKKAIKDDNKKAVEVLAWLAKGLVVCGSDEAATIVEALSELLDHPSLYTAAIMAFDIISAEYPELDLPVVKFLYKQKFFHTILAKLGIKLLSYCEHHLNAFIYVLNATPHKVLQMNIEKLGPILFKSLEARHAHTLRIALGICENFVKFKDDYFRAHLHHLIPSCLTLVQYKKSMQVRILALNLLLDITNYPIYVLLPHKMDVVLALATALDDRKRLVRNVAVQTRNAWYLLGEMNTY